LIVLNAYAVPENKITVEGKKLEDVGVDGDIKWILEKYGEVVWVGIMWFCIGTCGALL
jgi:hypothetical protein